MGAQAAALLDAGGPVGDVPRPAPAVGGLRLAHPCRRGLGAYSLDAVARGHGGVGLAPSAYDGTCLHRVLRLSNGALPVVVHPDLAVSWSRPTAAQDEAQDEVQDEVRRQLTEVLALDDDLEDLWAAFGPFAAATALPLLGPRPRPVVLDGWLRRQVPDPGAYAAMGRWAGTGVWLAVTAGRWDAGSAGRARGSPSR